MATANRHRRQVGCGVAQQVLSLARASPAGVATTRSGRMTWAARVLFVASEPARSPHHLGRPRDRPWRDCYGLAINSGAAPQYARLREGCSCLPRRRCAGHRLLAALGWHHGWGKPTALLNARLIPWSALRPGRIAADARYAHLARISSWIPRHHRGKRPAHHRRGIRREQQLF